MTKAKGGKMETVLYADILFLVNFAMDFISLSASASLGAKSKSPIKISIAAALGAIYAIFSTISSAPKALDIFLAIIVGASMCAICFGYGGFLPFVRQYIIFWCCSALLGGIMTAALSVGSISFSVHRLPLILIPSIIFMFFIIKAIRDRAGVKSLRINVSLRGRHTTFDALCDSGNLLRDPFSASPVIIVSSEVLTPLFSKEALSAMINCDIEALEEYKLRLIPQASHNGTSLLCAFFADEVIISSKNRKSHPKCLFAVSPQSKTYFAGFPATAPTSLIP